MTSIEGLHTSIQMHILMTHITFTYTYHFSVIYFFTTCFICYHISYTFHVILYFTSCSCNCILSSHSSAMFLISCHIFFTFHLLLIYIILCFMFANILEADTKNNCMYSNVLSLYETVISNCIYPKVSSLYKIVTYAI